MTVTAEKVDSMLAELTEDQLLAFKAQLARETFSPHGFAAFMDVVFELPLLPHMKEAIDELFKTKKIVVEAHVESAKTTTLSVAFVLYFIGHHPTTSNIIFQVSDDRAAQTAKQAADVIVNNARWRLVFPHLVPDRDKAWGAGGYEIKRTDMEYADWRELNSKRKEPTFVGLGYMSRTIIGSRYDGIMVIDDICDQNNTSSEREMENMLESLRGPILSRAKKECWRIVVGTPWVEGDALDYIKNTGLYKHIKIPVWRNVPEDTEGAQNLHFTWGTEIIDEWMIPNWPEVFTLDYLELKYRELASVDFARFMLLDLSKLDEMVFRWQPFPYLDINPNWPMVGGIDFASIIDESQKASKDRSYFAIAYVVKNPRGGAIVYDGIRERCTPAIAETHVERPQHTFPGWLTSGIELDGKGEVFYSILRRKPHLRLNPMRTGGKGKAQRLEHQMAPWFESGVVKISDADTPFLNALRKEMRQYPNSKTLDCMDAVYWALMQIPDVLMIPKKEVGVLNPYFKERDKPKHAFEAFSRS